MYALGEQGFNLILASLDKLTGEVEYSPDTLQQIAEVAHPAIRSSAETSGCQDSGKPGGSRTT